MASIAFAIFIPLLLVSSQEVFAVPHTLTDENAVVVIEDGAGGSNAGVMSYTVDGVNHMVQEAWWFRSTTTAVEVPIASLGVTSAVATDEDLDGDDDKLVITYTPGLGLNVVSVTYELTGGAAGSGIANLFERVNPSVPPFSQVEFYLYTNFDAEGNPINTAVRTAVDTVDQGVSGPPFATTTIMDTPAEVEFNSPASLLARLNDASPDTFVDTPVSNSFGPADVAFVAHHVRSSGMFVPASPIEVNKQITPAEISVPNVVGKSQSDAIDDIRAFVLIGGAITHAASNTVPVGNIISQNPSAGTPVSPGTAVDLEISVGSGNLFKLSFTAFLTFFKDPLNRLPPFTSASGYYIYDADSVDGNNDPSRGEYSYRASSFALDGIQFVGVGPNDPSCSPTCIEVKVITPVFGQFILRSSTIQLGGPALPNVDPGLFLVPFEDLDDGIFSTDSLPTTTFDINDIDFSQFESHFKFTTPGIDKVDSIEMVGLFISFEIAPLGDGAGIVLPVPTGQNVMVDAQNPAPGINSIEFEFDDVTGAGDLTIDQNQACPPNQGFQIQGFGGGPICFDINFDGTFTGTVDISINYDDTGLTLMDEQNLTLERFNSATMLYDDLTTSVDTGNNILNGTTTGFSFFAIFLPVPPDDQIPIGGEMIPLDTTIVLAAGAQYTAAWMIPVIVSAIGIGIVIARKF